ncbi:MAG: aspartate carbamoyltransferase, partial [Anaeromyxobacteraceae bacterium]|nr:aspartate carbamoyltransferase [Anaeromyxobacteraceae bacterium]
MIGRHRHLIGLEGLSREEILQVLDLATSMKEVLTRPVKKVPSLRGKNVVNLFFETSTRTRSSFEIAAKVLSADCLNWTAAQSSTTKGETLLDTAKNLEAMRPDVLVVRHSASGAPNFLARHVGCSVVSAGDGAHEHPSQGLLDCFTLRERFGSLEGRTVAIVGDISHSRVARSDLHSLPKLGAKVRLCGPPTMIPLGVERLGA